jgi:anti-sigma factor RsiW
MTDPTELTCQEAAARLDDFVDRELSPEELRAVERHLQECARCAPVFQFHEGMLRRVHDALGRIRAPEGLLASIRSRLAGAGPTLPPEEPR